MTRTQAKRSATSQTRQPRWHALADVDAVEIKVTIRPDQELRAERAMELNEDTAEVRIIYYYDTPQLDLFDAGVALRARLVKGDDDDSTVKFRPVEPAKISEEWKQLKGFKLEADCVGDRIVRSASLTVLQKRDEIDEVAKGTWPIEKLFSKDQERFLGEFYRGQLDFAKLRVLGPIRVLRWKLAQKGFPRELTLEEWRLPDGQDLVEVSIKTPPQHAPHAQKDFDKHLRNLGLDPEGAQETKTRTALNYFAKGYRKATS
jgi:adenylate cyclase class IV